MKIKIKEIFKQLLSGILHDNPVFIQLLGMCPTLAVTTSLQNGIGMGLATAAVLVCSNVAISLLRKLIPGKVRIAAYVVIVAGFVTILDLLLQAFLPELGRSLGLFVPLIVVNCIIFARIESFASKNGVLRSAVDGIGAGLGFTLALIVVSSIREILGNGTLGGVHIMPEAYQPASLMIMPVGGFLTLGFLIAFIQMFLNRADKRGVGK